MRFIADLVHEKKQLVEKAEAILQEAEKAGGSLTKEQRDSLIATQTKLRALMKALTRNY